MEWPRKNPWLLLLLLGATVMVQVVFGSSGCFLEEKVALLDFKAFIKLQATSFSESLLPSWVSDPKSDCCGWERVTCDSSSGHVIHLYLRAVNRGGGVGGGCFGSRSFNWSLFQTFEELRSLDLSDNCFEDFIWKGDYRRKSTLKRLETLDLSDNIHVNKSIMEPLSALTSLKNLFLAGNSIDGPLPIKELSLLRNLELLDFSRNELNCSLTTQGVCIDTNALYRLKKLKTLNLASNQFDKGIFNSLVALPALRSLFLSDNYNFKGVLDDRVLANLSKLEVLILRSSSLNGPLPIQGLCKMKQLQELDLKDNNFIGTLETCLDNLTSLRALDLSHNSLSGSIPAPFIARLASLEYLSLSYNRFEGLFSLNTLANHSKLKVLELGEMDTKTFQVETENPSWIPSFKLEFLQMSHCQVNLPTKKTPTFLSYQQGLRYIDLSYNNLVGMFPNWLLVNNPKLEGVFLNDNSFTGAFKLPFDLNHQMDRLRQLDLSNNQIQGRLPDNIGFFFPHLEYFDVSSNMFDGNVPASIGEMSNLTTLDLAYNNFSGEVPEHILLGCISLDTLRLSNNSLQGQIFSKPMNVGYLRILMMDNNQFNGTLPSWIGKVHLSVLSASRNNFEGEIAKELCELDLVFIDLSHNRFSGAIPSCFNMPSAVFIHLRGNSLNGTIPEGLLNSSNLVTIDLRDNNFTGSIPETFYGLEYLRFLLLAGNQLEGQVSSQICQLKEINILDLSRNNFTGSLPSCLNNLSFGEDEYDFSSDITETLELEGPSFYDDDELYPHFSLDEGFKGISYGEEIVQFITKGLSLSYQGGILHKMSGLDLSSNQLTGEIPHQIGDLHALHALNLSHNHLNGSIPESFHKLESIESLDLSNNNLSGQIPLQLQDLHSLSVFNVSYNNLSGKAPDKEQFGTFDESSYKGNPYLSWNNSNRGIATPPPPPPAPLNDREKNDSPIDFTTFYWTFASSYVMVLLLLVSILWINPHWRRAWFYFIEGCLLKCFGPFGQFLEDAFY